ncbi:nucleotidyltransferase family protein [Vogesella alkaliphila]|uniref:Alcohol dehydrogenase n=1 Tax=Vogesella alkaliphila TaxID=1193621 RepID=A0ABQ2YJL9_9NEIS|nr:nucleotidyltransferase family protein [Vogesella alkaliphila]GGX84084.1 alcohol dehydrogenase [Vogesella alkaliphila]
MQKDWKKVRLSPTQTLREALAIINEEALRIALVVDEWQKLLGIVTDGDIRRALLKGLGLEAPVNLVMNRTPVLVGPDMGRAHALALMQQKSVLSLPIVDDNGTLLGLETWEHALEPSRYDNPVFLMAGGFGTRLKPLTDHCPKPLLKVGDRPILETLLLSFIRHGFSDFYISTHYMPEQIRQHFGDGSKWNVTITYVHEEKPLGTGGALGLLPKTLPDLPLIMINGDVLTTVDFDRLLAFHSEHLPAATMCVREYDYQIPYGVIQGNGHRIISMVEKPIQRYFVNAGIYVVSPHVFKSVPAHQRIDMPTLLEQQMEADKDVLMFPIHEYWLDIGHIDDFRRAQTDIYGLGL